MGKRHKSCTDGPAARPGAAPPRRPRAARRGNLSARPGQAWDTEAAVETAKGYVSAPHRGSAPAEEDGSERNAPHARAALCLSEGAVLPGRAGRPLSPLWRARPALLRAVQGPGWAGGAFRFLFLIAFKAAGLSQLRCGRNPQVSRELPSLGLWGC